MRFTKYLMISLAAGALLTISSVSSAKSKQSRIYAYGFAASFNDSTVYFTDIQSVDSAWLEDKTNFLISRENYSYQLRDYLASKGIDHRTCIFAYALKRKDIENKFIALRKKYVEKGNFDVKYIASSDFVFKAIAPMENYDEIEAKNKAEQKKKKKEDRKRPPMGGPNQGEHGGNFGGGAPGGNGGMPPMR